MKYVMSFELTDKIKQEIFDLYPQVFGSFKKERFLKRFDYYKKFMLLMAYKDNKAVGFKFGYAVDEECFYSWVGGVSPLLRNHGVATELMRMQHEWCQTQGFKRIETKTRNRFPEMINLNLKFGFRIIGTLTETDGAPKIVLMKELE